MDRDSFSFEGIEDIEERIRAIGDQLSYVAVWDRTERKVEEPVGRFDFDPDTALPYLEGDEPDEGDDEIPPEADDETPQPQRTDLARATGGPNTGQQGGKGKSYVGGEELGRACCRWLRGLAIRNTLGWPHRRFRVRLCGPKGMATLDGGSFMCRNHGYEEEADETAVRELKMPVPTFEQTATSAVTRPMQLLGDYYAQWGNLVIGSVGQLQGVNNAMMTRLHKQLSESREQVDTLVAAILEYRYKDAVAQDERIADERNGDARTLLARDAIRQLGDAARAFLTARGIPPELAEVVASMGGSPELVAALNDPDVKVLMQDPGNLKALATMLKQVGAQARAARESGQAQNGPTANGAQAPETAPVAA